MHHAYADGNDDEAVDDAGCGTALHKPKNGKRRDGEDSACPHQRDDGEPKIRLQTIKHRKLSDNALEVDR